MFPEDLYDIVSDRAIEDYPSQPQAMACEEILDIQYSPDSFDFLDMGTDEAMPEFPEFYEPDFQRDLLFYEQKETEAVVPGLDGAYANANLDQEQASQSFQSNPVEERYSGDYTYVKHHQSQHVVQAICSKNDLQYRNDVLELLSIKATVNSDVRVLSQPPLSSCEINPPNEAGTTRFSPSLDEGWSLLDCWLAGIGQQLESTDNMHRNCSYPSSISLMAGQSSSVTGSDSKTESMCSFGSRAALGPRQGRRKRPAPLEDSASSTSSSHMSKRTHSSITCPKCCRANFKTPYTLRRHLKASCPKGQVIKESWICGPLSQSKDGQKCRVCQLDTNDTACTHRMAECWGRTEAGSVTFYRRDAMKTHLMDYHNLREDKDKANQLTDEMKYI